MAFRVLLAALLIAAAGVLSHRLASSRPAASGTPELARVPATVDGWRSREIPVAPEVERTLGADAYLFREYRRAGGGSVSLFVAYFSDQKVGAQIHSPRNCLPGGGWSILRTERPGFPLSGAERTVAQLTLDRDGLRQQAVYWFHTRSGRLVGEYALKLDLVRNSLRGRPTDAAFVRYMAAGENSPDLRELMILLDPPLTSVLRGVGLP